jgi:hypothetical protein
MEYAIIGKLLVEAVTAAGVLLAVILFLKDRRAGRAADFRDRAAERKSLFRLVDNAIAHNTEAIDANTRQQSQAAESLGRLADALDDLGDRLATRPCMLEERKRSGESGD